MEYPDRSYYDILGIPRNATLEQIKAAYREQIRFFHPDVFRGNPEIAQEKSRELNEAYRILSNPTERDKYDFWLKVKDYQKERAQQKEQQARTAKESENQEEQPYTDKSAQETATGEEGTPPQQENEAEGKEENKPESAKPQKNKYRTACIFLFILFAIATFAGGEYILDLKQQVETSASDLNEFGENTSALLQIQAFYKRAEECLSVVHNTFSEISTGVTLYTAFDGAEDYRNSVRNDIETAAQLAEDAYANCQWGIWFDDTDAMLMAEVRRLYELALQDIDNLGGEDQAIYAKTLPLQTISDEIDALKAMTTANQYFWNFYNEMEEQEP